MHFGVYFVGYVYVMGLINERKMEQVKMTSLCLFKEKQALANQMMLS